MSLKDCLSKIGLDEHESAILLGKEAENTQAGMEEREAALAAVESHIGQLSAELEDLVSQIESSTDITGLTPEKLQRRLEEEAVQAGHTLEAARPMAGLITAFYESKVSRLTPEDRERVDAIFEKVNIISALEAPEGTLLQEHRGFFDRENFIIGLLKERNLSTLLHESGHLFLEVERTLNEQGENIPEQMKKDWEATSTWLGLEKGKEITREQHEKFADGFLQYLREGRSPSIELLDMFRRFRGWLIRLFERGQARGAQISNEMREVFSRMLATEKQIDALASNPLFKPDPRISELLTLAERRAYAKRSENAIEAGKDKLLRKLLREKERENRAWWKKERKSVLKEVEAEVDKMPVYRAMHFLKTGKLLDRETPDGLLPIKMNTSLIQKMYGGTKGLPQGMVHRKGEHPEIVATMFGFRNAASMIDAMRSARQKRSVIKDLTDKAMINRHGDILNDGSLEQQALAELANSDRASQIAYELQVINRKTSQAFPLTKKQLQIKAREILGRKKLDDAIKPSQYYSMEVRSAREAGKALANKDFEAAALWKKRQLINHYLFRESIKARENTSKALKRFKRYLQRPARKKVKMDESYRQKIVELLSNYNLAPALSAEKRERLTQDALQKWMKEKEEDDLAQFIAPAEIVNADTKTHYRDLTLDEFSDLTDIADNIAAQGNLIRSVIVEGKRVAIKDVAETIAKSIYENLPKRKEQLQPRNRGVFRRRVAEYLLNTLKARTIIREFDGFKEFGPAYNFLMRRIEKDTIIHLQRMRLESEKVEKIFKDNLGKDIRGLASNKTLKYIPELDAELSKDGLFAIALNLGNKLNRQKLIEGYENKGWTEENVLAALSNNLSQKDWAFVQAVWDYLETFRPEIGALEERRTGIAPEWVESTPFSVTTSDGETIRIKGGYYPIVSDPMITPTAAGFESKELSELMDITRWSSAQTRRSHVQARTQSRGLPVRLDLGVIFQHMNQVVLDITMGEGIENAYKILKSQGVEKAIVDTKGVDTVKQLEWWLKDLAVGTFIASSGFEHMMDQMRGGVSIAVMGFKLSTTIIQPSGITHSIARSGIGLGNFLRGFLMAIGYGNPIQANETINLVFEKSNMMKERATTFHRDVYDTIRMMERKGEIRGKIAKAAFWPIVKMQIMAVDVPTWLGAYRKGIKDFNGDEGKAIEFADSIVIKTQSSGLMKDLSGFERGSVSARTRLSPTIRMWTVFYSYFNAKLQLAYESAKRTKQLKDVPGLVTDYLLLFWLEAIIAEAILGRMPDFEDDEESVLLWNLRTTLMNVSSMFIGVREIAAGSAGFDAVPPGLRGLDAISDVVRSVRGAAIAQYEGDDLNWARIIRNLNMAGGIVFKYPASQVNQALTAMEREAKGDDISVMDYLLNLKQR